MRAHLGLFVWLGLATGPLWAAPAAADTALITGANRGIGLEFVCQYAAKGWTVIATARQPDTAKELQALAAKNAKIKVERLDVADTGQIAALAAKYRNQPVDVLVNNAGAFGERKAQTFGQLDLAEFQAVMAVNVFGPLKMSEAFLDNVAAGRGKKVVVISSSYGSIGLTRGAPRALYYSTSKAAANMAMKGLSETMRERGISVGIYMPGGVDTRMMREAVGMSQKDAEAAVAKGEAVPGNFKLLSPEQSVTAVIARIEELDLAKSGKFLNYDGSELPW